MRPQATAALAALAVLLLAVFAGQANAAVHIASSSDITADRITLTQATFGQARIPRTLPTVTVGVRSPQLSPLPNVRRIDRLRHRMSGGFVSTMYLIRPKRSNDRLLVFHTGHMWDFTHEHYRENLRFFIARGYTILAVSMPLVGMNKPPAWMPNQGHENMRVLRRPLRPFLEPITVGLNYALAKHYRSVSMTGLSGGGWSTVMYAALDPRIDSSYPVAGSYPIQLRTSESGPSSKGDWEQKDLPIYGTLSYEDLYTMASVHRRQLAIYNLHDDCCFAGTGYRLFRPIIQHAVKASGGGSYRVFLDTLPRTHMISTRAERVIDRDIRR